MFKKKKKEEKKVKGGRDEYTEKHKMQTYITSKTGNNISVDKK